MGRPTKSDKRDRQLNIKLTAREHSWVKARAAAAGQRPVVFGRMRVLADSPSERRAEASAHNLDPLFLHLARVGNNLNQIARRMNQDGLQPPASLQALLTDIRAIIRKVSARDR